MSTAARHYDAEETFRVGAVIAALSEAGIDVARETVNRVSDGVLELDTRSSGTFDRRWTKSDIEQLIAAFRLRETHGLTWEGVASAMSGTPALSQFIDSELQHLRQQFVEMAARCSDLANLAEQLASRSQPSRASAEEIAA